MNRLTPDRVRIAVRKRLVAGRTELPGEIVNDEFAALIEKLAADPSVRTMLEVGSGSGDGSTRAFVAGGDKQATPPQLHCIETVQARADELLGRFAPRPWVHAHVAASAAPEHYMSRQSAWELHQLIGNLQGGKRSSDDVLDTYDYEIGALRSSDLPTDVISRIKAEHGIEHFDLVLLDGSDFCGTHDLDQVLGARWILLDDTLTSKNVEAGLRLVRDPGYRLIHSNPRRRNGFAAFERVDPA